LAQVIVRTTALTVATLPLTLLALMGVRYFDAPLFDVGFLLVIARVGDVALGCVCQTQHNRFPPTLRVADDNYCRGVRDPTFLTKVTGLPFLVVRNCTGGLPRFCSSDGRNFLNRFFVDRFHESFMRRNDALLEQCPMASSIKSSASARVSSALRRGASARLVAAFRASARAAPH